MAASVRETQAVASPAQSQPPPRPNGEAAGYTQLTAAAAGSASTASGWISQTLTSISRQASTDGMKSSRSTPAKRRDYDMCMVFPTTAQGDQKRDLKEQIMQQERESILKNLQNCGLHVHCFYSRDNDAIFCKIGANAKKMRDTAARMKYRLQLKAEYLSGYAEYRNDFPGRPENHFQDRRTVNHIYKTHGHEDFPTDCAIFSTRDKITIAHHIVTSKDTDCAGINIGQLMHKGDLRAYLPLHEDALLKELCSNKLLWLFMHTNHAMEVRDYFGEKIALYFLFMSYYWKALLLPAALGLLIQPINWFLNTPDNITAVPFCLFISAWAVLLPHFWKRTEAKYLIQWGTLGMTQTMEPCRPEFYGPMRVNPVTNQIEPHYPWKNRLCSYFLSFVVMIIVGGILMVGVMGGLVVRHLSQTWSMPDVLKEHRISFFQFGLAIIVEITNYMLSQLAKILTDRENHRTSTDYDRHKLIKVMTFKFVNSYFVLYYVAFFKDKLNLFGMMCMNNDCLLDLEYQLFAFVMVRLTLSNAAEVLLPRLMYYLKSCKASSHFKNQRHYNKLEMAEMSSAEKQSKKDGFNSFAEFDETLISHGYTCLFAIASPWVCAFTLIWVIAEQWLDVKALAETRQRPLPVQVPNNEPWDSAIEMYGWLAAGTNISLLVFASNQFDGNSSVQKMFLWVYLFHLIVFFKIVVVWLLPEMPRSVESYHMKQQQMAHRCLENIKVESEVDFRLMGQQRKMVHTVYDQDQNDLDAEEEEPKFQFSESSKAFTAGVSQNVPCCIIIAFLATAVLAVLTFIHLRLLCENCGPSSASAASTAMSTP